MDNLEGKILLAITGSKDGQYKEKIKEIKERGISVVVLFLEKLLPLK